MKQPSKICAYALLIALTFSTVNIRAIDYRGWIGIVALTTIVSHVIRPIAKKIINSTGNRAERRRIEKSINDIEKQYNDEMELPEEPDELEKHSHDLRQHIGVLKQARKIEKNNPERQAHVEGLLNLLGAREKETHALLQRHSEKEAGESYKEELEILRKRKGTISDKDLMRIVHEKHGAKQFICSTYKQELEEEVARYKRRGLSQETRALLEKLEHNANRILSKKLDEERRQNDAAVRDKKLFETELSNRQAVKDYYQEAQRQVVSSRELMADAHRKMKDAAESIERSNRENNEHSEAVKAYCVYAVEHTEAAARATQEQHQQLEYRIQETQTVIRQESERSRASIRQEHRETRHHVDHVADMVDSQLGPRPPAQNPEYDENAPSAPPLEDND